MSSEPTAEAGRAETFPKWIGLSGFGVMDGPLRRFGAAEYVTAPGKIERRVKCRHWHRTAQAARKCGQRLADRRNSR